MKKIILFISIVSLIGCEKDDIEKGFKVGRISDNSIYQKYDNPIILNPIDPYPSSNGQTDSIDVDTDGKYDLKLFCVNSTLSGRKYKVSYIYIINNEFEINYKDVIDTNSIYIKEQNDTTFTYIYNYHKPFNITEIDSVKKEYYSTSEPIMYVDGMKPSGLGEWSSSHLLYFAVRDSSKYTWQGYNLVRFTNLDKDRWNNQGIKYLIYRLNKEDDKVQYGWLKLEINDYCIVKIYESYFQKEKSLML